MDKELNWETDMLEGNINRMCITNDIAELAKMKEFALMRINKIYDINVERILSK